MELTRRNVERFRQQMQRLGLSYDWDREVNTTDPGYYKWTQWIFLQLYKMGLAYEATVPINWCPSCKTGLANEEVVNEACERCGTKVEQRPIRQWMLKITRYADQLLQDLGGVDWPQFLKELQTNWIGRSVGTLITFRVDRSASLVISTDTVVPEISVFTTRPDTLFGATFLVIAPDHPLVAEVTTDAQRTEVEAYCAEHQPQVATSRVEPTTDKTGVFTGSYVFHPLTGDKLPVWVADYVMMSYGTGAIMAVPAHDERDFAFATKYELPVTQVIVPTKAEDQAKLPYIGPGILMNSQQYDGQSIEQAGQNIILIIQFCQDQR